MECSLLVRAFGALDMVNMDYSVDITLRQRWRDPRLMFKGMSTKTLYEDIYISILRV